MNSNLNIDRRSLLQLSGLTAGCMLSGVTKAQSTKTVSSETVSTVSPNMIGAYGDWAANIVGDNPAQLSFRRDEFKDVTAWQKMAKAETLKHFLQPPAYTMSDVRIESTESFDGLLIEHLSWQLPYGPRTKAILLKPENATGKLPAILGLHDHGGMKFFGYEKITKTSAPQHPLVIEHQQSDYGGLAWANEIAKQGYVVLVHDTFTFASRRVLPEDLPNALTRRLPDISGTTVESVQAYNEFAGEHEHLMAKSLFCAGLTWPGVFLAEDQRALDYLYSRPDVDANRVGCAGLSGGGLRTTYLAGLDDRIKCACCVGMMSTWRDYLLHKAHTHTWMIYVPSLPRLLDYCEVLALRVPLPTLVLNNNDDPLFTLPEMQRADAMTRSIFDKANASEAYRCSFYPGPHKFDRDMQREAWDWFGRWLG
jgi:dienelactone hydrolase